MGSNYNNIKIVVFIIVINILCNIAMNDNNNND